MSCAQLEINPGIPYFGVLSPDSSIQAHLSLVGNSPRGLAFPISKLPRQSTYVIIACQKLSYNFPQRPALGPNVSHSSISSVSTTSRNHGLHRSRPEGNQHHPTPCGKFALHFSPVMFNASYTSTEHWLWFATRCAFTDGELHRSMLSTKPTSAILAPPWAWPQWPMSCSTNS